MDVVLGRQLVRLGAAADERVLDDDARRAARPADCRRVVRAGAGLQLVDQARADHGTELDIEVVLPVVRVGGRLREPPGPRPSAFSSANSYLSESWFLSFSCLFRRMDASVLRSGRGKFWRISPPGRPGEDDR